jgi:hypothetical protein
MSEFDDRSQGLAGQVESEIEVDRDVVSVEGGRESRERRSPFALLPLLLGLLLLLANLSIFIQVPRVFTQKNVPGAISLLLISVSVVICVLLIAFGIFAQRLYDVEGRSRSLRAVGVPLVLGLLAPLFTLWGLQNNKLTTDRNDSIYVRPCVEIYEKAAGILRDNPNFRLPATNPDEARCSVNAALGR